MSEQEFSHLKEEISRLNGLIDALLFQNQSLLAEIARLKSGNARAEPGYSVSENIKGTTNDNYSHSENINGTTGVSQALPDYIEASPLNVIRLAGILKSSGMNKMKRSGLRNISLILLQAHNKQPGSHKELRKLTGLSVGGLAKLIMSMKKRGIISRQGFQRFAVSGFGKELLVKWQAQKGAGK